MMLPHWFQYTKPSGAVEAQGYRGQFLFVDANSQTVIVRVASQPDETAGWPYDAATFAMQAVITELDQEEQR